MPKREHLPAANTPKLRRREAMLGVASTLALIACGESGASAPGDGGEAEAGADAASDAGGGSDAGPQPSPGSLAVDKVVSTATDLRAALLAWSSDWSGTVPAGKAASDERVIGLDKPVTGAVDLSGLAFPKRVSVRAVGTFLADYTCSTFVQGTVDLSGSSNLWLCLMEVRAPDNGLFPTGLVDLDATIDCGLFRCSLSGWPFTVSGGNTGTTAYAISPNGATRLTVKNNVYRFFSDGFAKWRGTMNNLHLEGNMGLYSGGDDYSVAAGCVLNDATIVANYFDRHHAKAVGVHNDGWQQNGNSGGSQNNRFTLRYNVGYRGTWTGVGAPTENGWQLWFMSGAGQSSTGPWLVEHCLLLNGQQRGLDRIPGAGTLTARYCAAIDSDVAPAQVANARFPRIIGADVTERNFVTAPTATYTNAEGTNGVKVILGGTDHTPLLAHMENVPTDTTDLWDIRPKVGSRCHPAYVPATDRVGAFELWQKLFAGDSEVVLSKVGWPVAPLFIADFDRGDHFGGTYTGNFDANGNNA